MVSQNMKKVCDKDIEPAHEIVVLFVLLKLIL